MSNQFGIKEVYNVTVVDYATKKPFLYVDYAESQENGTQAQRISINGGQGAYKLLSFDGQKESSLKLTLPLVDLNLLAMLAGSDLATGAKDVFMREELTVQDNAGTKTVDLTETPLGLSSITINKLQDQRDFGAEETGFTLTGKTVTLGASSTLVAGDKVVAFYQYNVATNARTVKIAANKFPKIVTIYGDGLWTDQVAGDVKAVKMTAYKAQPQSNFTITTSMSNATKLDLTFDLYAEKDADGDLTYIDYTII